jgi:hypothetical protein
MIIGSGIMLIVNILIWAVFPTSSMPNPLAVVGVGVGLQPAGSVAVGSPTAMASAIVMSVIISVIDWFINIFIWTRYPMHSVRMRTYMGSAVYIEKAPFIDVKKAPAPLFADGAESACCPSSLARESRRNDVTAAIALAAIACYFVFAITSGVLAPQASVNSHDTGSHATVVSLDKAHRQ